MPLPSEPGGFYGRLVGFIAISLLRRAQGFTIRWSGKNLIYQWHKYLRRFRCQILKFHAQSLNRLICR